MLYIRTKSTTEKIQYVIDGKGVMVMTLEVLLSFPQNSVLRCNWYIILVWLDRVKNSEGVTYTFYENELVVASRYDIESFLSRLVEKFGQNETARI